jgi:hypothetical protein
VNEVRLGYRDERAVYVMQDVPKRYIDLGTEKDIAWLYATCGVSARVWADEVSVMQHICNKVVFVWGLRSESLHNVL